MHQDDSKYWNGEERREVPGRRHHPESETFNLISETRAMVEKQEERITLIGRELKGVSDKIDDMHNDYISALTKQNVTIEEIHKLFKAAFPEADAEGHRRAHESWIAKEKQDKEFWLKLKQNTINWIVIAVLSWVGVILWAAFLQGPK